MSRVSLLIFLCLTLVGCSSESGLNRGSALSEYQERTVAVDGKQRKYRIFIPTGREEHPNVKVPVMLYLHGSGSRGDENREQAWAFDSAIGPEKSKVDFIVVLPQCRPDLAWVSDEMSTYALAALAESMKELNADPERIYLAGFSLGGHGVWKIASENPGKFAALMPVAGRVIPYEKSESVESYANVARNIGATPAWIFHGAKDDAVPVDFSRKIVTALKESGNVNVRYTEYAEDGHLIFGKAFAEPGFLEWLSEQRLGKK